MAKFFFNFLFFFSFSNLPPFLPLHNFQLLNTLFYFYQNQQHSAFQFSQTQQHLEGKERLVPSNFTKLNNIFKGKKDPNKEVKNSNNIILIITFKNYSSFPKL